MALLERGMMKELIEKHADRLGVPRDKALENALEFAKITALVESNGNPKAVNIPKEGGKQTSAKGMFQFMDNSISPAVNRLLRTHDVDWAYKKGENGYLKEGDIRDLDIDQQTLLFLADVLEKNAVVGGATVPGLGDEILKKVLTTGDKEVMKLGYEILHHTDPDEATKERELEFFK